MTSASGSCTSIGAGKKCVLLRSRTVPSGVWNAVRYVDLHHSCNFFKSPSFLLKARWICLKSTTICALPPRDEI